MSDTDVMSDKKVLDAMYEAEDFFDDCNNRFYNSPMKGDLYGIKEIQMFKILCKKFLDRLEEDENESSKL